MNKNAIQTKWMQMWSSPQSESLFNEIDIHYNEAHRHYHNWTHIIKFCSIIENLEITVEKKDLLFLAAIYHDIIYQPGASNNEKLSAVKAKKDLELLGLAKEEREWINKTILLTEKHQAENADYFQMLFLDVDLQILAAKPSTYTEYTNVIRKEFNKYPDFIYNNGRKKILKSFLEKGFIFKTDEFREKFEIAARKNIINEINIL